MSEKNGINALKPYIEMLNSSIGYVTILITFILAISNKAPGHYPVTTGAFLFVIVAVVLLVQRWPNLTHLKPSPISTGQILVVEKVQKYQGAGNRISLLDPFRSDGRQIYEHTLWRRRAEGAFLIILVVFAVALAVSKTCLIRGEFLGLTGCTGSCEKAIFRVVIAEFAETEHNIFLEDDLHDHLSENLDTAYYVCRTPQEFSLRAKAREFANQAAVNAIIWGRKDVSNYEVNLEAGLDPKELEQQRLSLVPTPTVDEFSFRNIEVTHLDFLTRFVLSDLMYETGRIADARLDLEKAISVGKTQGLSPKDLAQGYLFMGILFHTQSAGSSDLDQAIRAYTRAIDLDPGLFVAVLNRGLAYAANNDPANALLDFNLLIEQKTPLAAEGYINRAGMNPDCTNPNQFDDLKAAIQIDPLKGNLAYGMANIECEYYSEAANAFGMAIQEKPDETVLYHLMGKAWLYDGQFEQAKEAYRQMLPYLRDEESRAGYIDELTEIGETLPELREPVDNILILLRSAPIQAKR